MTGSRRGCLTALLALFTALPAVADHHEKTDQRDGAGQWAHWRGPEHNGFSRERNLPEEWSLESGKNVAWVSDVGGRATPIVLNGKVYLNCRTEESVTDPQEKIHARQQVVCWDAATGEILWKDVFNVFLTDIPAPRVGWAAMAGDPETGNVYVHTVDGFLRCYDGDGKDGKPVVKWGYSLFEDFGKLSGYGGRTQTPIVDEDQLVVSFLSANWGDTKGPGPMHTYYSFDKKTGELRWVSAPGGPPNDTNYSNPIVAVIDGVRMLIGGNGDGGLYAMQARTGKPLWGIRLSERGLNTSPVVDGNRVYIAHGEDNLDTVEFGSIRCIDGAYFRTLEGDTDTEGGKGFDLTDKPEATLWREDGEKTGYTGLLIDQKAGILYAVSDNGVLLAYDTKTGKRLWTHDLGNVGKGSPILADGKIYVMEVNGIVHILKPSREECQELSRVQLRAGDGAGTDEIYASPAVADGRVFLVTRDRTICLKKEGAEAAADPVPPLPEETSPTGAVARVLLLPYETRLAPGGAVTYQTSGYDENGRFIDAKEPASLSTEGFTSDITTDGAELVAADPLKADTAGKTLAEMDGVKATARLRAFPALPWSWDFDDFKPPTQVPPTWVRAFVKLKPKPMDGGMAMSNSGDKGRPSTYTFIGPSDMKGYTVEADVRATDERRQMANVGLINQRYVMTLKGNNQKLEVFAWPPHKRMAKEVSFRWKPDTWYRAKFRVDVADGQAMLKGKVWPRGEDEPAEWTIEQTDPHANPEGAPGLYNYALSESLFDNVEVYESKDD